MVGSDAAIPRRREPERGGDSRTNATRDGIDPTCDGTCQGRQGCAWSIRGALRKTAFPRPTREGPGPVGPSAWERATTGHHAPTASFGRPGSAAREMTRPGQGPEKHQGPGMQRSRKRLGDPGRTLRNTRSQSHRLMGGAERPMDSIAEIPGSENVADLLGNKTPARWGARPGSTAELVSFSGRRTRPSGKVSGYVEAVLAANGTAMNAAALTSFWILLGQP
jgi:hypothetical protein